MKHVRLTMRAPDGAIHPVFDMLTRSAHVERVTGLHWNVSGDRLGILHYVEGDPDEYAAELDAIPSVLDYELLPTDDGAFYAYHRCTLDDAARDLWETVTGGTLLVVPPVEFGCDGAATFSVYGPDEELQAAIDGFPEPIGVEIDAIGTMAGAPQVTAATLSDRQREAVEAALSLGYYEIPREVGHEDVAEEIGCAPSTAAEHLRKAESKLVRSSLKG